jgi:hypothetical protein
LAKEKFPNHEILEFSGDDIEEPMFIDGNYSKGGTTSYAGGGEISNKNIGVAKRLKIKNWYIKNYPTDDLGEEIDSTITFWELWTYISQGYDVYAVLGVTDSLVRERVFEKLSQILDVDYDVIYNEWLSSSTYAKGGRTYLSYDRMSRSPFKSNTKQKLYDMGYTYDYLKGLSSIQAEKLLKQNSYAKGGQVKVGDIVTFRGQGKYEVIEQTPNSRTMFTIKDIDRGSEKGWHLGKNEEFGMESEVHKKFLEPITEYAKGGEIKIGDIMEISVPEWKYSAVGGEKTNWIKTKGKVIRFDKMKGGKRNVVFEVKNMSKNPEMLKNKPFLYYGFDEDMFAKGGTTTYAKGGRLQEEKDMKMIGKFAFGMLIGGLFGFIKK